MQHAYADNDGMVGDKEVDIVYIANVHIAHKATALPLLAVGKNILCEKPLSVNAKETRDIYKAADDSKKFFLVGLWSRFFPAQQKYAASATCMLHCIFSCWICPTTACVTSVYLYHGAETRQCAGSGS